MSDPVRLCNLTDVPTEALRAAGLTQVPLVLGRTILQPGEEITLELDELTQSHVETYVRLGALSAGEVPAYYRMMKAKKP